MQFNSLQFIVFFIITYALYIRISHKWQNKLLLFASCIFYAAWDWRFLPLIFISISTDYFCSIVIHRLDNEKIRKCFLILSIAVNLSILGFFKYFNFFAANFAQLINLFGFSIHPHTLKIILPIGISFYTFKTMSYTIDVYTGKIEPTRNYLDYALFVIFFPLLLAGPIMRAGDLLPQVSCPRKIRLDSFYEGCHFIFWGLFQKIFIADNLAKVVDKVFNVSTPYNGVNIILALYAFAFQIYCDFAGYSNMARGLGKCMGFDITINFNLPYFATNPQDFWNRWHISLSTWLRDYLYYPIALSKRGWGNWSASFATMVTFSLCGLWHGANWTFVLWGTYQGLLLIIHRIFTPFLSKIPLPSNQAGKNLWFFVRAIFFFHLVCLGWLFFRAQSITQIGQLLSSLFMHFDLYDIKNGEWIIMCRIVFFVGLLLLVEYFQYRTNDSKFILKSHPVIRYAFYCACLFLMIICGVPEKNQFIYFQF